MTNPPVIHYRIESDNNEIIWLHYLICGYSTYLVLYLNIQFQNQLLFEIETISGKAEIVETPSNFEEITKLLDCTIENLKQAVEAPFCFIPNGKYQDNWQISCLHIFLEQNLYEY